MKNRNELLEEMAYPPSERVNRIQVGLKTSGCPLEYLEESTLDLLEQEEEEKKMNYKSCAQWNSLETGIEYSEDSHYSLEAAESVCRMLREQGFGGQGRFFPIRTWTEPLTDK